MPHEETRHQLCLLHELRVRGGPGAHLASHQPTLAALMMACVAPAVEAEELRHGARFHRAGPHFPGLGVAQPERRMPPQEPGKRRPRAPACRRCSHHGDTQLCWLIAQSRRPPGTGPCKGRLSHPDGAWALAVSCPSVPQMVKSRGASGRRDAGGQRSPGAARAGSPTAGGHPQRAPRRRCRHHGPRSSQPSYHQGVPPARSGPSSAGLPTSSGGP